jgi:hypothetical protein
VTNGRSETRVTLRTGGRRNGRPGGRRAIWTQAEDERLLLAEVSREADASALGRGRVHELTNGAQDRGDGFVVSGEIPVESGFELIEAPAEFAVRSKQLAHPDERSHDLDVDGNRALAAQSRGKHRNALLGEGSGRLARTTPA